MIISQCMNCMEPNESDGACPHCGFMEEENAPANHHLAYRSILNGKYMVGCAIGEGGFGITYIGWDLNLGMKVAIKEYYPDGYVGRNGEQSCTVRSYQGAKTDYFIKGKEQFLREARSLGKFVQFPGIVSVKDFFQENNTVYIVMEYLEGMSLKDYAISNGNRVCKEELLDIVKPVINSLKEVHNNEVIHRDISPDNIMICKDGQVKLIDFGAAREVSPEGEKTLSVTLKKGYTPEEQYRTHGEQGPWTDVYSMCATIYTVLTGVKPDTPLDRMENETLKRPGELGVNLTKRQEDVLMKGLAIKACDRVQNMDELYSGLYLDGKDNEFTTKKKKSKKKWFFLSTLLILLALIGGGVYYFTSTGKVNTILCSNAQINQEIGTEDIAKFLPDGAKDIVFHTESGNTKNLLISGMPENGNKYDIEVQYTKNLRKYKQKLEITVLEPEITLLKPMVSRETGEDESDYSNCYTVKNADYLKVYTVENSYDTDSANQTVDIIVSNDDYIFAKDSIEVVYYDLDMEEFMFRVLLENNYMSANTNDKMQECADCFIKNAEKIGYVTDWNLVLEPCSQAVIDTYPEISYSYALAIPMYESEQELWYSADTLFTMLYENNEVMAMFRKADYIGISACTVKDGENRAVYWCIYFE